MPASNYSSNLLECIIVDDEPDARNLMESYCQKSGRLSIKGIFFDALAAMRFLEANKIDVLFLDIHLPEISGLAMLQSLSYQPKVIFTTAFSEHSLEAFNFHVVDYLLKPVRFERFLKAINKLNEPLVEMPLPLTIQFESAANASIQPDNVLYVEAFGNYLKVHTSNKVQLLHLTMKDMENKLHPYRFVRCHKSYLLNPKMVASLRDDSCTLVTGITVPIGISYRQQVKSRFEAGRF